MPIDEVVNELRTIQDMLRWAFSCLNTTDAYYGHGTDNSWDEAVHIVLSSLHLPLDFPKNMCSSRLTLGERHRIVKRLNSRIKDRVPVAYLTNKAWLCGYEFYVDERVLIPRSPIGKLISSNFSGLVKKKPQHILDMCTGSGCLAIICAYVFPEAEVDAVDISNDALAVAEINILNHSLLQNVTPIYSDLFCELPSIKYDVIVTNPPYVNYEEMKDLPVEYQHEPKISLEAGIEGLDFIHRILFQASDYLEDNGLLICECGDGMENLVKHYPNTVFNWFSSEDGDYNIFSINKAQLIALNNS